MNSDLITQRGNQAQIYKPKAVQKPPYLLIAFAISVIGLLSVGFTSQAHVVLPDGALMLTMLGGLLLPFAALRLREINWKKKPKLSLAQKVSLAVIFIVLAALAFVFYKIFSSQSAPWLSMKQCLLNPGTPLYALMLGATISLLGGTILHKLS